MSSGAPEEESLQLSQDVSEKLGRACRIADSQQAAQAIIQVEQRARVELQKLESRYRITRPRIALNKAMQKEWSDYAAEFSRLTESVFRQTRELIEDIVEDEAAKARIEIDRRLRVENHVG